MCLIPVNVGFKGIQLCKSLILSTSQWGNREKLRDLFEHTEIVETNKEWIKPRKTRYRTLCAEPVLLVPQSQSTCWTVHAERQVMRGTVGNITQEPTSWAKARILSMALLPDCWLPAPVISARLRVTPNACNERTRNHLNQLYSLFHSFIKNFYASRTKLLDIEKKIKNCLTFWLLPPSC